MKRSTRLIALLLIAVMALTLAGCHKKNETVMTVGDTAIPSGLYLAFQLEAYSELIGGVNEQVAETSDASQPQNYADYFNFEYEGKKAETFVADRTKALAIEYAVVQDLFAKYELELTKEDSDYIDTYAEYYWEQNIGAMYEPNGVSLATYTELMSYQYKKSKVFDYYYDKKDETTGKGGLQTVADSEIIAKLASDYVLADIMPGSLTTTGADGSTSSITADAKTQLKAKFDAYADKLNKGGNYSEIYKEYTGSAPQNTAVNTEEGPNTIYSATANVFSAGDSDATIYNMLKTQRDSDGFAYGKAYVLGGDTQGAYYLTMMYEIAKDAYYVDQYRSAILHELKDDEFDKLLADEGAKLTYSASKGLLKYYKPTNIDFDAATAAAQ